MSLSEEGRVFQVSDMKVERWSGSGDEDQEAGRSWNEAFNMQNKIHAVVQQALETWMHWVWSWGSDMHFISCLIFKQSQSHFFPHVMSILDGVNKVLYYLG